MRPTRDQDLTFEKGVLPGSKLRPLTIRVLQLVALIVSSSLPFLFTYVFPFLELPKLNSLRSSENRLYEEDPVYKGPKESPSTLDSLDLKHRDSRPCLNLVLSVRDSKNPKDFTIARSCLERAIQNESSTASEELLSHLHTLQGDLLIRHGEAAEAISDLETASKLNPDNSETAILLLRAYKVEEHKLRAILPPWPEERQRRIHELGNKIETLEKELCGHKLSLLVLSSGTFDCDACTVPFSSAATSSITTNATWIEADNNLGRPPSGIPYTVYFENLEAATAPRKPLQLARVNFRANLIRPTSMEDLSAAFTSIPADGIIELAAGTYIAPSKASSLQNISVVHFAGHAFMGVGTSHYAHMGVGTSHYTHMGVGTSQYAHLHFEARDLAAFGRNQVLAVGVNGDGGVNFDRLNHAAEDAQRVSVALRDLNFRSTVLVDTAATGPKILAELSRVVQISRPGDVFVFYFSGHGFTDIEGNPVLVTGAAPGARLDTLSLEEINYVLSFHRGRAFVLLDNCLNVAQIDSGTRSRLIAGPNRPTFILAGSPDGRVIESSRLGSGLFTSTLLRFLGQQRSHPKLDFDAMFQYTATETSRLARVLYGEDQRPQWLEVVMH